jgi:hypothetical protein
VHWFVWSVRSCRRSKARVDFTTSRCSVMKRPATWRLSTEIRWLPGSSCSPRKPMSSPEGRAFHPFLDGFKHLD